MVTIKELIEKLQSISDQDRVVVIARDPEGNGFETLWQVEGDNCQYHEDDREISLEHLTPELEEQGYCEDDIREGGKPAVCLWP